MLYLSEWEVQQPVKSIDLYQKGFTNGLYIILIKSEEGSKTKQVVINNNL